MMTVHEVSDLTGVSIRTLHHYDHIGLLPATEVSPAGYRLYDEQALERLQIILLFRALVKKLQSFITEHFYTCSDQILHSLGEMYAGGGQFTRGIDRVGGEGTAGFAYRAIDIYCSNNSAYSASSM